MWKDSEHSLPINRFNFQLQYNMRTIQFDIYHEYITICVSSSAPSFSYLTLIVLVCVTIVLVTCLGRWLLHMFMVRGVVSAV
jgi:hypothetical protein